MEERVSPNGVGYVWLCKEGVVLAYCATKEMHHSFFTTLFTFRLHHDWVRLGMDGTKE
jgi:hypothetical protein